MKDEDRTLRDTLIFDSGYRPRKHQEELHLSLHHTRFAVLVCHRRFGKTVFAINHIIDDALRCEHKNPQYAYVAPTYGQAKRVAWEYIKEFAPKMKGYRINETELSITIPRYDKQDKIKIFLLGAENPDSLRGIYLDGAILDEYGQMSPELWGQIIRPALSDRKGKAIFIGTPKGKNHFYDLFVYANDRMDQAETKWRQSGSLDPADREWFAAQYRASETKIIDPDELESARRTMTAEEFAQEYETSFSAAMRGAYYSHLIETIRAQGQICHVAYDRAVPVETYWDLGIADATSIWFMQQVGVEFHVIDYQEFVGISLYDMISALQNKGYVYGEDVLPHDAAARELGTGKTREEVLRALGRRTRILPKTSIMDGIEAVRQMLPMCWFDKTRCKKGLMSLEAYQKEWDPIRKIYSDKPLHDWSSHGADAMRVMAMGRRRPMENRYKDFKRLAEGNYDPFKF